jgi:hypothetical protein
MDRRARNRSNSNRLSIASTCQLLSMHLWSNMPENNFSTPTERLHLHEQLNVKYVDVSLYRKVIPYVYLFPPLAPGMH